MLSKYSSGSEVAHPLHIRATVKRTSGRPKMILREILQSKGTLVHTIDAGDSLDDVVQKLVHNNCGSLVVYDSNSASRRMVGIITERDILRAYASRKAALGQLRVAETMTTDVVVGSPQDSIEDTMGLMTNRRIRHLPVIEEGELVGLVSIGDIVKTQHDRLTMENHYLKTYLHST
jgi:CBS domain-containing protein